MALKRKPVITLKSYRMFPFYNQLINAKIKRDISLSARHHFSSNAQEVAKDTNRIVKTMRPDLKIWARMIQNDDLDEEELCYLIGKSNLGNLDFLVGKGCAEISVEQYKTELQAAIAHTIININRFKMLATRLTRGGRVTMTSLALFQI